MFPFPLLQSRSRKSQLESFAQEICNACRHSVRLRVEDRCGGMSLNEMRGYVRARAAGPVRSRASQRTRVLGEIAPRELKTVVQQATDLVVSLVLRDAASACAEPYCKAA